MFNMIPSYEITVPFITVILDIMMQITLQGTNISPKNDILSRWLSFSQGGICDRSLEGTFFLTVP